jgi:hypothetical protein
MWFTGRRSIVITATDILRGAEDVLGAAASSQRGPWGIALAGLGAAAGLAADLLDHGHDAVIAIEQLRSIVPAWTASRQRLADYLDELARKGVAP